MQCNHWIATDKHYRIWCWRHRDFPQVYNKFHFRNMTHFVKLLLKHSQQNWLWCHWLQCNFLESLSLIMGHVLCNSLLAVAPMPVYNQQQCFCNMFMICGFLEKKQITSINDIFLISTNWSMCNRVAQCRHISAVLDMIFTVIWSQPSPNNYELLLLSKALLTVTQPSHHQLFRHL